MADEDSLENPGSLGTAKPAAPKKVQKKPYLVVCEPDTAGLENSVMKLILQGYRPHGSLQIQLEHDEPYYYQAMILHGLFK